MKGAVDKLLVWVDAHARFVQPVLVLAVCLLAVWLRTLHLTDVTHRTPDEQVYTASAQQIVDGGLEGYRAVFQRYLSEPARWIYPGPTRLINVLLFAGVMKVTGSTSAQAGAGVSWLLSIGSVLLLARWGRRFVGGWVGVLAAFFLATYVVQLEFARRAWGESTSTFVTLLLLYAACALDREPTSRRWTAGFFAAGVVCLLTKETTFFAYGLVGGWLCARQAWVTGSPARALRWIAFGIASIGVAFGVLVLVSGSPSSALAGWLHVFSNGGLGTNTWGARYASGPWYQFLQLLAVISPLTASMVVAGVVAVLSPPGPRSLVGTERGARASGSLAVLVTLGLTAACAFGPNLQYMRLMAPADPMYCVLAAIGLRALSLRGRELAQGWMWAWMSCALPVLLAAASTRDYRLYEELAVRTGIGDFAGRGYLALYEQSKRQPSPLAASQQALAPAPRPVAAAAPPSHLARSFELCSRSRWAECVAASQAALRENANQPQAWNNAAVGYAGLELWDDAVRCAEQAVKLNSEFPLARNNLAWATRERAKRF